MHPLHQILPLQELQYHPIQKKQTKSKKAMNTSSEKNALVLEIGTKFIKCGLSEERAPRGVLRWEVRYVNTTALPVPIWRLWRIGTQIVGVVGRRDDPDAAPCRRVVRVSLSEAAQHLLRVSLAVLCECDVAVYLYASVKMLIVCEH